MGFPSSGGLAAFGMAIIALILAFRWIINRLEENERINRESLNRE